MFNFCICIFVCIVGVQSLRYEGDPCVSEGLNGTCVSLRYCLFAVRDIKMNNKQPQLCSYKDSEPIVCCTDCWVDHDTRKIFFSETGEFFFKTGSIAEDKCLEYITIWKYDCDLEYIWLYNKNFNKNNHCYHYTEKVIGGGWTPEYVGQYPHMALLGYGEDLDVAKWHCEGAVISDRFILTAAHCTEVNEIGPVKFVALGILKRSDPPDHWQHYNVKRIITHPKYKHPIKYHDIALLEVSTIIKFSSAVLPACLKVWKKGLEDLVNATATGWGTLGPPQQPADELQTVTLKKFSTEECTTAYPPFKNLENGIDHDSQICFGDKEKFVDTFQGDSGGPLHVPSGNSDCVPEILGVNSFGAPRGNATVYTLVTNYISWIEEIVWP